MSVPITVLMSVYNGERFLKESILSILNQSFKDFEFIIIDDGSTDNSKNILKEFSILDKRIRLINKKNSGLTKSLNLGISMARGEWIARIDDDDISAPQRLEIQYSYAKLNKSLALIGSNFTLINLLGSESKFCKYPRQHNQLKELLIKKKKCFPHSSFFINSKIVKKINGYNERIKRSQDYELCLRLIEAGEINCIQKPLVKIRKHSFQVSHENNGLRQIVDSHVALIGFLLKNKGFKNPLSITSSDILFKEFYNFVSNNKYLNAFFKYQNLQKKLKSYLLDLNLFEFIKLLIKSLNFLFFYFFFYLVNKNIELKILNEWIKKKS
jgi:glycosyltransferase involved in cell wall biosynthesis